MGSQAGRYPGVEISMRDFKSRRVFGIKQALELQYAWSHGEALSRFFQELKNGRIIGRKCYRCQRILVPPRVYCEQCFRRTDEWAYVQDTGTVNTFSVCYVDTDASRLTQPRIPAVIELDGAGSGVGILHVLGEVEPQQIRIGMRVKAVWLPPEERRGAITDIRYFRPLE